MAYQRVLTIQDISCVGQCSMTVAMPVLSACGVETCILPTALLSSHTGGFRGVQKIDLTDKMFSFADHWEREGIRFDTICSGYLGSTKQIDHVIRIMDTLCAPDGTVIVDPAMADNGKLYAGFDEAYVQEMKRLCRRADIVIPNITEACMLTGMEYQGEPDETYISRLLEKLHDIGCKCIILTGVGFMPEETGVMVSQNGTQWHYRHPKVCGSFHGTGDLFAAAFAGALANGKSLRDGVRIASEFVAMCIRKTAEAPAHWYGVKFEPVIPDLIKMLDP